MPMIVEDAGLPGNALVSRAAELRLENGILVNGVRFRADDPSTQRVGEMLSAFKDGIVPPEGAEFRTASGALFTLTQQAQAQAIYDALRVYRGLVLSASAALQAAPPSNPYDVSHWPARPSITLS